MQHMRFITVWTQFILILSCRSVLAATRSPLTTTALTQSSAFECGKPGALCGKAVPADANCKKGPGFCTAGHYCSKWVTKEGGFSEFPKCLPLPKDCGTAGNECCPSNKDSPHQSLDDSLKRQPTCTDGSHCFYYPPRPFAYPSVRDFEASHDPYVALKGATPCKTVPKSCGTEGSPCCPIRGLDGTYNSMRASPELPRAGCVSPLYCNLENRQSWLDFPATGAMTTINSGTCMRNTPDCGQFGKRCCISMVDGRQVEECGGPPVKGSGQVDTNKGYCANPPSRKELDRFMGIKAAPLSELVCTPCPAKTDKIFTGGKTGQEILREHPGMHVCPGMPSP